MLEQRVAELGLSSRVHFPGSSADVHLVLRAFDIVALFRIPSRCRSACSKRWPPASRSRPTDVGDIKRMVSPENRPFVAGRGGARLARSLAQLVGSQDLRRSVGDATVNGYAATSSTVRSTRMRRCTRRWPGDGHLDRDRELQRVGRHPAARLGLRDAAHPVVVVDNASDQDESASLVEFGCHLLRLPRNTGFAGGCNAGARYALARGAEWVLFLNNDVQPEPGLADRLAGAAHDRGFHIIGPIVLNTDGSRSSTAGPCSNRRDDRALSGDRSRRTRHGRRGRHRQRLLLHDLAGGVSRRRTAGRAPVPGPRRIGPLPAGPPVGIPVRVLQLPLARHVRSATFDRESPAAWRYYDVRNLRRLVHAGSEKGARRPRLQREIRYQQYAWWQYEQQRRRSRANRPLIAAGGSTCSPIQPDRRRHARDPSPTCSTACLTPLRALARGVEQVRTSARTRAERAVTRGERRR